MSELLIKQDKEDILKVPMHGLLWLDVIKLSLRIFRTKPTRTILTILGMSVGTGTVVLLVSLGYGLQYILIGSLLTSEDSIMTIEASYPSESVRTLDATQIATIKALEQVDIISPVAEVTGELSIASRSPAIIPINRIVLPTYFKLAGVVPDIGQVFTEESPGVILSSQALLLLGFASTTDPSAFIGKEVAGNVSYLRADGSTEVATISSTKIVGIISDETEPPLAYIPYSAVSIEPITFTSILVKAKNVDNIASLRDIMECVENCATSFDGGFLVSAKIDIINQAKKITTAITVVLMVFGTAALLVSAIGMFNTMIVGFIERIYEVGVMKSLGATNSDVQNLFLTESVIIGFLGGIFGLGLGIGAGELINTVMNSLSAARGGDPLTLFITPVWFAIATLILSSIIGLLSGFWPSRRAAFLSPREAFVRN